LFSYPRSVKQKKPDLSGISGSGNIIQPIYVVLPPDAPYFLRPLYIVCFKNTFLKIFVLNSTILK
jgi:hypothetical protein